MTSGQVKPYVADLRELRFDGIGAGVLGVDPYAGLPPFDIEAEFAENAGTAPKSLRLLAAIAAVTQAVVTPAMQCGLQDFASLGIQLSAAVSEAGVTYEIATTEVMALLGYLYEVLAVVEALEFINGFGSPDSGGEFRDGSLTFSGEIFGLLHGADPVPAQWSGPAAALYREGDIQQQIRVDQAARADQQIAGVLAKQAAQVERGRQGLAGARLAVFGASAVVVAAIAAWKGLAFVGAARVLCQALRGYVEYVSCIVAAAALALIVTLVVEGADNRRRFIDAAGTYQDIVDEVNAAVPSGQPSTGEAAAVLRYAVPVLSEFGIGPLGEVGEPEARDSQADRAPGSTATVAPRITVVPPAGSLRPAADLLRPLARPAAEPSARISRELREPGRMAVADSPAPPAPGVPVDLIDVMDDASQRPVAELATRR